MTRRERHLRIIENMGEHRTRFALQDLQARHGLALFTDAAVEQLARSLIKELQFDRRLRDSGRRAEALR